MTDTVPSPDGSPSAEATPGDGLRVVVLGATGTIGRATVEALVARGHRPVCFVRPESAAKADLPPGAELRRVRVTVPTSVARDGFRGQRFDAVVSCMASRSGVPRDAWAVEYQAHVNVLAGAREAKVRHFVLLSAICVQKPRLEFQRAKLAFEEALRDSGLTWSIVRATAFFKSLSGQVKRVQEGKPFLVFGDGTLTACTPIGDEDLAEYLVGCLEDPGRWHRILPIGGPGPALTARRHGELIFEATGMEPRFRRVPVAVLHVAVAVLGTLGRIVPALADKAELAKIGRYYATESMLVWDEERGRYDAEATPAYGTQTLGEYYRRMVRGEVQDERGEHAVL